MQDLKQCKRLLKIGKYKVFSSEKISKNTLYLKYSHEFQRQIASAMTVSTIESKLDLKKKKSV